jgi:hypothetical protein
MRCRGWAAGALGAMLVAALGAQQPGREPETDKQDAKARERAEQAQRQEGQAVLTIADTAMAGKPVPSDFPIHWQNDFLKAQQGTFVPFTLTIDSAKLTSASVLMYVRAAPRGAAGPARNDGEKPERRTKGDRKKAESPPEAQYPVDAIFPVDLSAGSGGTARIRRGFSVPPGEYDVYVVIRERPAGRGAGSPKTAVIAQALSVPNFWSNELTTSSVILADRLNVLSEPISADELVERPYVIGQNDITPATDTKFKKDEELIVVFLVYNPTVTPEKKFDLQVEYHFFRVGQGTTADATAAAAPHPPEREGERYFNHTEPQRFNPAIMGAQFDPNAGHPVMAGQGIPLAGFEQGDYRLAIRVTDLISGKSLMRDVNFTVGS